MTDAEMQANGEASVGTFIKELDGSSQGLPTDGAGILSFKSIQRNGT